MSGDAAQLVSRAREFRKADRPDLALRLLEEALRRAPEDAEAHAEAAFCHDLLGDRLHALESAQTAVRCGPGVAQAHLALAWVRFSRDENSAAAAAAREAIRLTPGDAWAHRQLALGLLDGGDARAALVSIDTAISLCPEQAAHHATRSSVLGQLERKAEALVAARLARSLAPAEFWNHYAVATAAEDAGDAETAAESFREALRWKPTSRHARIGLLRALRRKHLAQRLADRIDRLVGPDSGEDAPWIMAICAFALLRWNRIPAILWTAVRVRAVLPLANGLVRWRGGAGHLLPREDFARTETALRNVAVALGVTGVWIAGGGWKGYLAAAAAGASVAVPFALRNCQPGLRRTLLATYCLVPAGFAAAAVAAAVAGQSERVDPDFFELHARVWGTCCVAALWFVPQVAGRCGHPWTHRFEAPRG